MSTQIVANTVVTSVPYAYVGIEEYEAGYWTPSSSYNQYWREAGVKVTVGERSKVFPNTPSGREEAIRVRDAALRIAEEFAQKFGTEMYYSIGQIITIASADAVAVLSGMDHSYQESTEALLVKAFKEGNGRTHRPIRNELSILLDSQRYWEGRMKNG